MQPRKTLSNPIDLKQTIKGGSYFASAPLSVSFDGEDSSPLGFFTASGSFFFSLLVASGCFFVSSALPALSF
jgi:hypothetical protein